MDVCGEGLYYVLYLPRRYNMRSYIIIIIIYPCNSFKTLTDF